MVHDPEAANSIGDKGMTPLHYAAERDDEVAVALLVSFFLSIIQHAHKFHTSMLGDFFRLA